MTDLQLAQTDNSRLNLLVLGAAAIIVLCLIVLRWGSITEAVRLNIFAVEITRQIAGDAPTGKKPDIRPSLPETERLQGVLSLKQGNTAEADSYFENAIRGSMSLVPLVRAARPKAEALARTAYTLYPQIPDTPAWVADTLPDTESAEKLALYRSAAALEPADNLLWEKVGELAASLHRNDVALDAFKRACDINPIRNGACHQAARYYYAKGDWEQVIYYFKRGSMPEHSPDWVLLIKAAQQLGLAADADSYLQQAQARNPDDYGKLLAEQP